LNFFPKKKKNSTQDRSSEDTEEVPDAAILSLYRRWATKTAYDFASALAAKGTALAAEGAKGKLPKKLEIRSQIPRVPPSNVEGKGKLFTGFPYVPAAVRVCKQQVCELAKSDSTGVKACKHDVERLLRASGSYSYEWLRQERIRWHPDRFAPLCQPEWRDTGRKLAEEMFKIIGSLMADLEGAGANPTGT